MSDVSSLLEFRFLRTRSKSFFARVAHRLNAELATHGLIFGANNKKIANYKDAFRGQRCFILGNGPSLKNQDLSVLRDEHVFCSNWFALHPEFPNLGTCFFTVSDPHLWNYGDGFHPELLQAMQVRPDLHCFFESSAKASWRQQDTVVTENVVFLRLNSKKPVWEGNFSSDLFKGPSWGYTVILDFSLPIAFYMGFETVYLLGCDCDYKLDKSRDFSSSFFFDIEKLPEADLEHMARQRDQHQGQEQLDKWTRGYKTVREYFESRGRRIFNAGHGGKLEVFPRIELKDVVGKE